jgi:hypothetical protein
MLMQCDAMAGWLAWNLSRWDGKTQKQKKRKEARTARPPAPDGDETCFGGGGGDATVVWFFLFRVNLPKP